MAKYFGLLCVCVFGLGALAGCESVECQTTLHERYDPITGEPSHSVTASFSSPEVKVVRFTG